MGIRDTIHRAAQIGPRALMFRALWEANNRSGLRSVLEPVGVVPVPPDLPAIDEWTETWPFSHPLRSFRARAAQADRWAGFRDESLIKRAEAAAAGRLQLFDDETFDFGDPPDFHLEPVTGQRWTGNHWSRALDPPNVGDPRTTWEANRFGWIWDWVRAYARQPEPRWGKAFDAHLSAWERQNPYRMGINWASGQELAVRSIAWAVGGAVFGGRPGFSDHAFRRLCKQLYWHGCHLDAQLDFARLSVPNNHLLAESLALAILGEFFPLEQQWRERGLDTFADALRRQFREDGGYCQNSHRYHRYALELVLLADRWFPELCERTEPVLQLGFDYFEAMVMDSEGGRVPNFGPNDGAALFRLTACEDDDYRPLLGALAARLQADFPFGPWSEQAAWLYDMDATARSEGWDEPESATFPSSGLHVLHRDGWSVAMRCGAPSSRGGHADQLHLDIWHNGRPIAVDAGSCRYFDPAHRWHVQTESHNTVTVDGIGQMKLVGRFTWVGNSEARLDEFDPERGRMVGNCAAYRDAGLLHERTVEIGDAVCVTDRLSPVGDRMQMHTLRLHWLVPCDRDRVHITAGDNGSSCFTWNIETPIGTFDLRVSQLDGSINEASAVVEAANHAPRYGASEIASSIVVHVRGPGACIETRIGVVA